LLTDELISCFTHEVTSPRIAIGCFCFAAKFGQFAPPDRESRPLACNATRAVQAHDFREIEIALRIEAEVAGDEKLCAVGREDDGGFQQQRLVALYAPEIVFPAEEIEDGLEALRRFRELRAGAALPVSFRDERAPHDFVSAELRGEACFDVLPVGPDFGGVFELCFVFRVLLLRPEIELIAAFVHQRFGLADHGGFAELQPVEAAASVRSAHDHGRHCHRAGIALRGRFLQCVAQELRVVFGEGRESGLALPEREAHLGEGFRELRRFFVGARPEQLWQVVEQKDEQCVGGVWIDEGEPLEMRAGRLLPAGERQTEAFQPASAESLHEGEPIADAARRTKGEVCRRIRSGGLRLREQPAAPVEGEFEVLDSGLRARRELCAGGVGRLVGEVVCAKAWETIQAGGGPAVALR